MLGMHGSPAANTLIQESDLILSIGSRFDDRTVGNLQQYAPAAKLVSILLAYSEKMSSLSAENSETQPKE